MKKDVNELIELYKIINQADDFDEIWDPEEMTMKNLRKTLSDGDINIGGFFDSMFNKNILILI